MNILIHIHGKSRVYMRISKILAKMRPRSRLIIGHNKIQRVWYTDFFIYFSLSIFFRTHSFLQMMTHFTSFLPLESFFFNSCLFHYGNVWQSTVGDRKSYTTVTRVKGHILPSFHLKYLSGFLPNEASQDKWLFNSDCRRISMPLEGNILIVSTLGDRSGIFAVTWYAAIWHHYSAPLMNEYLRVTFASYFFSFFFLGQLCWEARVDAF